MVHGRWIILNSSRLAAALTTTSLLSSSSSESPLLKFGIIADIQYADVDDAENFAKTEKRFYRGSLEGASQAVKRWSNENDIQFIAQLGDLIDGQNNLQYGSLKNIVAEPQSEIALKSVIAILDELHPENILFFHACGNHELMNFEQVEIQDKLFQVSTNSCRHVFQKNKKCYFEAFRTRGWRFLQLDAYANSILHPKHLSGYKEAAKILRTENPNDVVDTPPGTVNFFNGLSGSQCRFVPFNGGLGQAQLDWLVASLHEARAQNDKVVLFSHLPLHPNSASWRNVPFDAPHILDILNEYSDVVVAVFAGHSHSGGYYFDPYSKISHITVQATLTHRTAFGICDLYHDRIQLRGFGALPSRTLFVHAADRYYEEEEDVYNNEPHLRDDA